MCHLAMVNGCDLVPTNLVRNRREGCIGRTGDLIHPALPGLPQPVPHLGHELVEHQWVTDCGLGSA